MKNNKHNAVQPKHELINDSCQFVLTTYEFHSRHRGLIDTIFADPPDNIGKGYSEYNDNLDRQRYVTLLSEWLWLFVNVARTIWFSYNPKWTFDVGAIVREMLCVHKGMEARQCVQTFTFGQHNNRDLGNNHRPLLRLRHRDAPLFPDSVRVQSERQKMGDKRANPKGRVPGDVFDFPRVTGNSRQRRSWHPTQLNEGLVERCILLTTPPGGTVLDPFAGTGTTLRVCKRTGHDCILIECDKGYCREIAKEHGLEKLRGNNVWRSP